jgi:ribosomal protein L11 methyltransferase
MRTWPAIDVSRLSEPDLLQAALIDYDVAAVDEQSPESWIVFFHTPAERDRAAAGLPAAFPGVRFVPLDVPDDDWARRSQAELHAVRVGGIVVAPPWDVPDRAAPARGAGEARGERTTLIVIEPSMGFGTGHHATTRLCLAALQPLALQGRTVVDVGTGSGVLAIAACLLGASMVVGIDDDPDAVQSARENAERNGVTVDFRAADFRTTVLPRGDLVLANLTGALLLQTAPRLQDLVNGRGALILSGFLQHEEAAVLAAFSDLRVADRNQEDEWVCVTLRQEAVFV